MIDETTKRRLAEVAGAILVGIIAALLVHAWGGDEVALCQDTPRTECPIGSGASWAWTGVMLFAPLLALAGFSWTRHLREHGELGPFARSPIPDWEELVEGLTVVLMALVSFVIIRNGPTTPMVETSWLNSLLVGHLGETAGAELAPARRTWFIVGALMGAPFSFSLGSAVGREWYRWRRRRADKALASDDYELA